MFKRKPTKKLVTHNGSFHADDVFACAALILLLEKRQEEYKIIRTREEEIIETGDYVFDVGGAYNPAYNRFDHHQPGGAGKRGNGIEYAAFGLVWRKFGDELSGHPEAAELVDRKLVSPIDAGDNGLDIVESTHIVKPYFIQHAFKSFRPTWQEANEETMNAGFLRSVDFAKEILIQEIRLAQANLAARKKVVSFYEAAKDKRIIVLDQKYPWEEQLVNFSEPLFVIFPRINDGTWGVEGVNAKLFSFEKRRKFPAAWAGLREGDLQNISGVSDAVFCHRGLFMAVARSKEGAVKLAELAVKS